MTNQKQISNLEIERKFLVKSTAFKDEAFKQTRIVQGFLSTNKNRTVRVRLKGEQGFLTVKGASSKNGLSRFEWEKEITKTEAESLLQLCKKGVIDKIRYEVKVNNHIFEVDEFFGENQGLIVAEVELQTETETFVKPDWLGKEVTGKIKYYNSQLSSKPFAAWKRNK
ncbi:CYTH domain-containing protein [Lacinutrix sp. C3R15]|uniref:CYTH domain-containing protein n=1 Tax=Flavobacteriaceae TaxID=49546 RepID=UPI001C0998DF|nr:MULTISPECIES: CYTH domain-containing protein [Flavobacteriaceae]MBU2937928.1 CYTH domain-containing protein [Lacinutrix sp. C3R15]MDO6621242.1 CYTH domain-containing protein [Oceanihabitans sp. 1_MG-2023]